MADEQPAAAPVEEVPAEAAPAEAAPAEESAPAEEPQQIDPEFPKPDPLTASAADVSAPEAGSAVAYVNVAGGIPDTPTSVVADGFDVTGAAPTFTLTKKNVGFGDATKYSFTATCGEESITGNFSVKVGPAAGYEYEGKYPKGVADEDAEFRAALRKVQKFSVGKKVADAKEDIWALLKSANPREYDRIAFYWGIKDLRKLLKKLANAKKNNKKSTSFPTKLDDTHCSKIGDKIVLAVATANEAMNVKWSFNGKDIGKLARSMAKGCNKQLVIDAAGAEHNGQWTATVGDDKTCCEVFVRKPAVTLTSGFSDIQASAGEEVTFTATMSSDDGRVKLLKDGIEFGTTDKISVTQEGTKITCVVHKVNSDDSGFYQIKVNGGSSFAELIVSGAIAAPKPLYQMSVSGDVTVACDLADEKSAGKWFKGGKAVVESDRVVVEADGVSRKLNISAVAAIDAGTYEFRTEGAAKPATSFSVTANDLSTSLGLPQVALSVGDLGITTRGTASFTVAAAEKCALTSEGKEVSFDGGRMKFVQSDASTAMVIENAWATDSGKYDFGDKSIAVAVFDVPTQPGKPVISDLTDETCRVDWTPPKSNGGSAITSYTVQRKRKGESTWVSVGEAKLHNYLARRLVDGQSYQVRVIANSAIGAGEPSDVSEPFTPLAPSGPVTSLRAGKQTDTAVELKWNIPEEIGAAGIDGYVVQLQILPGGLRDADPAAATEEGWKEAVAGHVDPAESAVNLVRLTTGKNYMFRMSAKNQAGASSWATLGPVCCASSVEDPKILLPRNLKKALKINVNDKIHVNVPFQGAPKPKVTWTKLVEVWPEPIPAAEEGGEPTQPPSEIKEEPLDGAFTVRTTGDSSVIFVRNATRAETGTYKINVEVQDLSASATIDVAVVDVPSKPRKLQIVETIGTSVQLKWEAPTDNGNLDILGYSVDKRDKRSGPDSEWYVVYDKVRHCNANIDELILGNDYQFRVRAINEVGAGEGTATKEFATIVKETTTYVKPAYPEMNFDINPEFTTALNSRKIMLGYSGTITCALKASPRPKIRWFKNKMEIIDNPKYKMSWGQGIIQLEIRRARLSDAGTYTVQAENELGTVTQSCEVSVREAANFGF